VIGIVSLWIYVGSTMMLYMAGIAGIDQSLFEAAYIDGRVQETDFLPDHTAAAEADDEKRRSRLPASVP
jgi:hypothetical protein